MSRIPRVQEPQRLTLLGQEVSPAIVEAAAINAVETANTLREKWHRIEELRQQNGNNDVYNDVFRAGMQRAYAECIRLLIMPRTHLIQVERMLKEGQL